MSILWGHLNTKERHDLREKGWPFPKHISAGPLILTSATYRLNDMMFNLNQWKVLTAIPSVQWPKDEARRIPWCRLRVAWPHLARLVRRVWGCTSRDQGSSRKQVRPAGLQALLCLCAALGKVEGVGVRHPLPLQAWSSFSSRWQWTPQSKATEACASWLVRYDFFKS